MKRNLIKLATAAIIISSFTLLACNSSKKDQPAFATATLTGTKPDTAVSGMVQFSSDGNKVKLTLQLTIPSMPNKAVAVHIHQNGNCGEIGQAAGGHWNPTNQMHGKWGGNNYHLGDIGNVTLDAKGNGHLEMETDKWSIGGDDKTNVLNHSIIVHNGTDDFVSQPSGNSGERIACGIIRQTSQ
ncbi:MAG TPA: superoxide dismutase family protein [Flavisolibacter sp.]|nr:superoxide dismutase family protein [Flavisolibacter sp.]